MNYVKGLSRGASGEKTGRIAVIERSAEQEFKPIFPGDIQALLDDQAYPSLAKFLLFWTMMDTVKIHGYTRAAMSIIGRSTIGAWWKLAKHEEWGEQATETQQEELFSFYSNQDREWDNIKDYQQLSYKLIIGAMYLRFFGQVAFFIVRDNSGQPIGFDHLSGFVMPNVDNLGYFRDPAFVQYPSKDPRIRTEFTDPKDIVYIINPDWEGSPLGGSDVEALTEFTLPLDVYLQTAAREYIKNTNRAELIYMLPNDISDDAFDTFVSLLNSKYGGPMNRGRNPIAVQGELDIKRVDDLPDGLPYQESRRDTREETLAVTGASGAMLGLSDSLSSANIRESRRQFHETTMEPLFRLLEGAFYEQIHIREFDIPGWMMKFNHPDFLTAVERATVHMRYIQWGVMNPNEAREELGREPREGGEEFTEPKNQGDESQGSPPEGREPDPDDDVDEPTDDDQDPPRGDQHDEEVRAFNELESGEPQFLNDQEIEDTQKMLDLEHLVDEIKSWRKFAISRMKRGRKLRKYRTKYISNDISQLIQVRLEQVQSVDEVKYIFEEFFGMLEEIRNE
ncbi:phage portal protein [bacterium]|nr:phage portal protein [bacterium]